MSQAKEIYWVCRELSEGVKQKVKLLQKYHIAVKLLSDFQSLLKAYGENRLNTIIIGDEGDQQQLENAMMRLSNHPEYAGVRFILSLSRSHAENVNRAVDLGFRDIIPVDLTDSLWLRRYAFASSGRPTELNPPHPQMSMQAIASVQIPGRIAWLTNKELWLETRLTPPVGSELNISGGLADLLGLKQVRLKVMNRYRSHLHFRYSEALLCRWEIAPSHQLKKIAVQDFLDEQVAGANYRFYAIVKNRELRNLLVKKLPADRFHLTVALNKNNMIQEPRYISPDAVLIEDKMCMGAHQSNFEEMLENLDIQVPVFIFGDVAKAILPKSEHRIIPVTSLNIDFKEFFESSLGPPKSVNQEATPIPKNSPVSFANILLPARLTGVHPDYIEIASGYPLGRFGLFGVEAPVFQNAVNQRVHGKVLDTFEGDSSGQLKEFPYRSRAIVVDLAKPEREALSKHLVDLFRQQMIPKGVDYQPQALKSAVSEAKNPQTNDSKSDSGNDARPETKNDQKGDPIRELLAAHPDASSPTSHTPLIDFQGAGPMRTEVARNLREPSADPSPMVASLETEVRPLEEQIFIDRNYEKKRGKSLFVLFGETLADLPKEVKIAFFVALGVGLALWAGFYLRQPLDHQAMEMTDQLKKYQEQHGGKPRPQSPTAEPTETFEP